MWNTLHVSRKQGNNKIIPYYQKFNKDHVIYLQFESDSPDSITLESFNGLTSIESVTNSYVTSYGTTDVRYYTNFVVTLNSGYYDKKVSFVATQGTDILTSEPIYCYDLLPELSKGTIKYIKYTNFDRNESDLDDRFVDWSALASDGNYMDFFVDAIDIDPNDSEKNEVLDGSQSKVILSASYYSGRTLKTGAIPDYMATRLGVASSLDIFTVNGIQYIKSEEISQERFGNSTLYQASLRLTQKNSVGINVDNLGVASLYTASVNPTSLQWAYNETDTKTFVVTTNLARWYFGSGSSADESFTIAVYDSTNTTDVTEDDYFTSGMVVRVTPTGVNTGITNFVSTQYITDSSLTNVLSTFTGTQSRLVSTASVTPTSLNWAVDAVDTKTFVVNTNMDRWYFGSGSDYGDYSVEVYDSTNTTKITNGIYTDGMVVRVTPLSINYGSSYNVCMLNIADAFNATLSSLTGIQDFGGLELSINHSWCVYSFIGDPLNTNSFTVTHSGEYTYEWATGDNFTFTKSGDTFTVTANGTNETGSDFTDQLIITQGALTVYFGVVQHHFS
jgi:hypothetical protein